MSLPQKVFQETLIKKVLLMVGFNRHKHQGAGKTYIGLGLWTFSPLQRQAVARRAKVLPEHSSRWFDLAFGASKRVVPVP